MFISYLSEDLKPLETIVWKNTNQENLTGIFKRPWCLPKIGYIYWKTLRTTTAFININRMYNHLNFSQR